MNHFVKFSLFIAAAAIIAGCSGDKPKETQKQKVPVGVFVAHKGDVNVSFEFPAKITSEQNIDIVAKVAGTLLEQKFKAGDFVKSGDVIFVIDPEKYQAAFDSAKAKFHQAELDYKRAITLHKTNTISQKEYDSAIATYGIAKADFTNAKIDLGYTEIKAPFDGVLGDPYKDVGAYISLSDPRLVRLTKLDPINADFAISEVDALTINSRLNDGSWEQKGANIVLNLAGKDYNGSVVFIDKVVNDGTGAIDAKASFDNKNFEILPGAFARVKMDGFVQKDGFKIPQLVIQQDPTTSFVYAVKDGKIVRKNIKISSEDVEFAVVYDGINDNDKIVKDNFAKIGVGVEVEIVEGDK